MNMYFPLFFFFQFFNKLFKHSFKAKKKYVDINKCFQSASFHFNRQIAIVRGFVQLNHTFLFHLTFSTLISFLIIVLFSLFRFVAHFVV